MKHYFSLTLLSLFFGLAAAQPIVNLGNDTLVCGSHTLTPGTFANASYLWSTGATTSSISAGSTGTYWVRVTTPNGIAADTIYVQIFPLPAVSAGNDTVQCGGEITLQATTGMMSYLWSTGGTQSHCQALVSGTYSVTATDSLGCSNTDWVNVTIHPLPFAGLGADRYACDSTKLYAAGGTSRLWSTGSTAPVLSVHQPGTYSVTVLDANTGCVQRDTVTITVVTSNFLSLNPNRTGCDSVLIDATINEFIYRWSNGDTLKVAKMYQSGSYNVIYMDSLGVCIDTQYFNVTVHPGPGINLGPKDTIACTNPFVLNPGGTTASYLWSTGATFGMINVTSPGTYSVAATANNGCVEHDTINVTFAQTLSLTALTDTVAACDSVTLIGNTNITPLGWLWSTGEQTKDITVDTSGYYVVTVLHPQHCPALVDTVYALVKPQPTPLFTYQVNGQTVTFTNTSLNATSFLWNLGDNQSSTAKDPVHTYLTPGVFLVNLAATNECGTVLSPQSIPVIVSTDAAFGGTLRLVEVAPALFSLVLENVQANNLGIRVVNSNGQEVFMLAPQAGNTINFATQIDATTWTTGVYFVQVTTSTGQHTESILVR